MLARELELSFARVTQLSKIFTSRLRRAPHWENFVPSVFPRNPSTHYHYTLHDTPQSAVKLLLFAASSLRRMKLFQEIRTFLGLFCDPTTLINFISQRTGKNTHR